MQTSLVDGRMQMQKMQKLLCLEQDTWSSMQDQNVVKYLENLVASWSLSEYLSSDIAINLFLIDFFPEDVTHIFGRDCSCGIPESICLKLMFVYKSKNKIFWKGFNVNNNIY